MTAPRTWVCPLRLASPVRQRRVASADPHEQAPLSAARPAVPWSMKQCSCDRPRDSPTHPLTPPFNPLSLCTPASRSPLPSPIAGGSSRRLLARLPQPIITAAAHQGASQPPRGFPHPCISPWHSAHEDEPYHQQLSLSDRNDKIAWTMAECAPAQPHTPHTHTPTH